MIDFCGFKFGDIDELSPVSEMLTLFKLLRPQPSPTPLMRIGDNRDGSYLVPDDLKGITACFSPGVNNFKYFEDFLVENYGIDCHMCDFSSDVSQFRTPLFQGKQTFLKKWLDTKEDANSISLDRWVCNNAPDGDLLLQIDIEGAEYRNLLAVSEEVLDRFRVIVIEVHDVGFMKHFNILNNVLLPVFRRLDAKFQVIHAHPNNCDGQFNIPGTEVHVPNVMELTYLRRDRFGHSAFPCLIPHPLDVSRNVQALDAVFLGEEWLDGPRPIESKVKMLEDRLADQWRSTRQKPTWLSLGRADFLERSVQTLAEKLNKLIQSEQGPSGTIEIAGGKAYVLSSAYEKSSRSGVVGQQGNYFFHTNIGFNEFITVDLAAQYEVCKIVISNRLDECFDRANGIFLIISITADHSTGDVFSIPVSADFLSGNAAVCEISIPPSRGQFVTIAASVETALHFSDLKVFVLDGSLEEM